MRFPTSITNLIHPWDFQKSYQLLPCQQMYKLRKFSLKKNNPRIDHCYRAGIHIIQTILIQFNIMVYFFTVIPIVWTRPIACEIKFPEQNKLRIEPVTSRKLPQTIYGRSLSPL